MSLPSSVSEVTGFTSSPGSNRDRTFMYSPEMVKRNFG